MLGTPTRGTRETAASLRFYTAHLLGRSFEAIAILNMVPPCWAFEAYAIFNRVATLLTVMSLNEVEPWFQLEAWRAHITTAMQHLVAARWRVEPLGDVCMRLPTPAIWTSVLRAKLHFVTTCIHVVPLRWFCEMLRFPPLGAFELIAILSLFAASVHIRALQSAVIKLPSPTVRASVGGAILQLHAACTFVRPLNCAVGLLPLPPAGARVFEAVVYLVAASVPVASFYRRVFRLSPPTDWTFIVTAMLDLLATS